MLEEVVVIVLVEERLYSIRTVDGSVNESWKRTLRNPQKIVNNSLLHQ